MKEYAVILSLRGCYCQTCSVDHTPFSSVSDEKLLERIFDHQVARGCVSASPIKLLKRPFTAMASTGLTVLSSTG